MTINKFFISEKMLVPDIMNKPVNTGEQEQKFDKRKMVYKGYKLHMIL